MSWEELVSDLEDLAVELAKFSETSHTAIDLYTNAQFFSLSWGNQGLVETGGRGIRVPPPRKKALFPRLCEADEAAVNFRFLLGPDYERTSIPKLSEFQVRVSGSVMYNECVVELEDHWRVDSHDFDDSLIEKPHDIFEDDDEVELGKSLEPHPYIHFQRGGHAQDSYAGHHAFVPSDALPHGTDWRSLMQAPGPRIPFLPHCPILVIDYVIAQHNGTVWRKLRRSAEYSAVVRKSQARLWRPFFSALSRAETLNLWVGPIIFSDI